MYKRQTLLGAGWKVKLVLMKVKPDARLEKIALSMVVLYRNRLAVSKVDVPNIVTERSRCRC